MSFATKTHQTYKPIQNALVLPPKLLKMFFWVYFVVFDIKEGQESVVCS